MADHVFWAELKADARHELKNIRLKLAAIRAIALQVKVIYELHRQEPVLAEGFKYIRAARKQIRNFLKVILLQVRNAKTTIDDARAELRILHNERAAVQGAQADGAPAVTGA